MFYTDVLSLLSRAGSEGSLFRSQLSLPNIPMPVLDGGVFWSTIASWNGLRLQQHHLSRHARILDQDNVRIAWGTVNGMEMVLDRLARFQEKYDG